jgi:hypothetical protein
MKDLFVSLRQPCLWLAVLGLVIGGCASRPESPQVPASMPELERHHAELDGLVSVDYQIRRKISTVNQVSCYAFITGSLNNYATTALSRRTVLDFNFFSSGKQVFRDLTSPVSDVPPGGSAQFTMVVSPVHWDGCIPYDPIIVSLRKVLVR